jgi:pyruvate/2-oxoglutarate dehydrogenase complex dihydrolipoamide dehydrogenase (E3) component
MASTHGFQILYKHTHDQEEKDKWHGQGCWFQLFHRETHKLLGVHALGQWATEIVHIGQAVLFYGGSVEYFRDIVFNYPTLAEAYKAAALDGLHKL